MPTIDIPDRVCPYCGGTRWGVYKTKDWRSEKFHNTLNYYTNYTCANISPTGCSTLKRLKYNPPKPPRQKVSKEHTRKRHREYHQKNKHKWISQTGEVRNAYNRRRYKSDLKFKEKVRDFEKKYCLELADCYIKKLICQHEPLLDRKSITPELIKLKRKELLLKRQINTHGKDN